MKKKETNKENQMVSKVSATSLKRFVRAGIGLSYLTPGTELSAKLAVSISSLLYTFLLILHLFLVSFGCTTLTFHSLLRPIARQDIESYYGTSCLMYL
jgi:hypothetical protein